MIVEINIELNADDDATAGQIADSHNYTARTLKPFFNRLGLTLSKYEDISPEKDQSIES